MSQTVKLNLVILCLMYQHKDIAEIEKNTYWRYKNICDWFVDTKLSIYFGHNKIKSILSTSKQRIKNTRKLNARYKEINIKQQAQVTYLGCVLDKSLWWTYAIKAFK